MPQRVTFYIDGFNFYHGLKSKVRSDPEWKKYYWIDFVELCRQFLGPDQELKKVKYFTARPTIFRQDTEAQRRNTEQKQIRQAKLFKANRLLNPHTLKIIFGKYHKTPTYCMECHEWFNRLEEKRTDVNISIHMIGDCARDYSDVLVLVSADSDMVPPVEYIQGNFLDKKVKVYFPPDRSSADLLRVSNRRVVHLENNTYRMDQSIMPETVTIGDRSVTCPEQWRI